MGTPKNREEWMVSYLCPGQSSLCHTDPWANNNKAGIAAKWGQLTTGISLACESGWAGKVRKKSICSPGKQWGNEMEIGTSEYLHLSPRRALGCREQFPKSSVCYNSVVPSEKCLFAVRCAVAAGVISFLSAGAGDKGQNHWQRAIYGEIDLDLHH